MGEAAGLNPDSIVIDLSLGRSESIQITANLRKIDAYTGTLIIGLAGEDEADPDKLKDKSRVTFAIEPLEDMVCLTVTHDNFQAGSKMAEKVSWGWPRVLSSLKTFLETGKGLNIFCKG